MKKITRDFVATVYVVDEKKTLLIFHKKLRMWLPPGGHMDNGELPEQTAVREVREETGLDVKIISKRKENEPLSLIMPEYIQLENIWEDEKEKHEHIDFIYLGVPVSGTVRQQMEEIDDVKWFSEKELNSKEVHPNIRRQALRMIEKAQGMA